MEKTRFGFNYLSDERKAMVLEALERGDAVCIIPSCVGHTRAEMVKAQAEKFFEEVGAHLVDVEHDIFKFYKLDTIKWEDLNATEQMVVEKVLDDIESGEIDATEDFEIESAARIWDQEFGFLGAEEESRIDVVCEMVAEFMKGR